jgi:hypothetical protein
MAKAKLDITTVQNLQTEAQKQARKALNAGVGVTDLAVGVVRDVRQSIVDFDPRAFGAQTVKSVNHQVTTVPARVQQVVDINVNAVTDVYGDLVKRGETLVRRIRRQKSTQDTVAAAETTVAKAKTTRTQATSAAKKSASAAKTAAKKASTTKRTAAKSSAKATRTSAKKTVSAGSRALADAAKKIGD